MSRRAHKRALAVRDQRRQAYDALRDKQGSKRPGSLNPRKHGLARGKRK